MRKKIASDWGLALHIPRRINDGGVKVNTLGDSGISCPKSWEASKIIKMIIKEHKDSMDPANEGEFNVFVAELEAFTDALKVHHLHHPNAVANALIVERNYKFQSR